MHNDDLEFMVIGTGFSGIAAGKMLLERGIKNFAIMEKSDGIGGTWHDNHYPGAACDVASHFYCYSFEPNPDWSRLYSPQREIEAYIRQVSDKYGVSPYIRHNKKVGRMVYNKDRCGWDVSFADGKTQFSKFVINGAGGLHEPNFPVIEGRNRFQGPAMHTARWDKNVSLAGKRVAVIGSAASAVQLVPELQKTCAKVDIYQRTPNYIAPRNDFAYPGWAKNLFRFLPFTNRLHRNQIMQRQEKTLYPVIHDKEKRREMREQVMRYMRHVVKDKNLHQYLEPNYELGCKRILISDNFYQSLNEDNVDLVPEAPAAMDETGIWRNDGSHHDYDIIVYATGYDVQKHAHSIDVIGKDGLNHAERFKDGMEGYRSVMVAGLPNYFMTTGPNSGVGTTSVLHMIENALGWIFRAIDKHGDKKEIAVRSEAQTAYNSGIQEALSKTVWASGCDSYYISPNGRIESLYPGNAGDFSKAMKTVNDDDLTLVA